MKIDEITRAAIVNRLLEHATLVSSDISTALKSSDCDVNRVNNLSGRLDGLLLSIDIINDLSEGSK